MTSPEDALEQARANAAEYAEDPARAAAPPPAAVSFATLMEWAVIDPDPALVRSTRRYGGVMTALKRGLVRLLAQYHADVNAQQTRFNVNLVARMRELEERIEQLERERS